MDKVYTATELKVALMQLRNDIFTEIYTKSKATDNLSVNELFVIVDKYDSAKIQSYINNA